MKEQQTEPVTAADRPLEVTPNNMKYGAIEGVEKPISRIICGTHTFYTLPDASVVYDPFFEMGGNCFDTSHVYGGSVCERILAQWIH
ncbi:MAG: oxidoreductase, partial [Aeromicrobium sp.]|nr:oxidoreductase [Burkholderiales bacterium]